ncbi:cyclin-like protein [Coccomyxa subellipsoidea C-169]|uniref:Cyclin-like protein n=1 Tax=Coccomyxa subellipsoidea (strain C-169) TaxID=574566 RepID=I0YRB1_COCSC|nr:cyclin-like protein [Coccomyxa subellipsoidea C-169]EIE20930.1 cyclin-like protein [Coccomyxa subellipsoidea C-169]|eukprot:XP_005645474.1 cyclin-like protein [Coccomyxa subellipsoidea C-169]
MAYCGHCKQEVEVENDDANGYQCCTTCGAVLDEGGFSTEVTFTKGAGGVSTADGQFLSDAAASRGLARISGGRGYGYQLDSHEKSLNKGRSEVTQLVDRLRIAPRDDTVEAASRLYKLALSRNFTRGRRTQLVAAACLYIVCRQDSKPFMLIDFSDALQVNVFTLGAVFLHLCKLLRLEEHPMFQRPVDPSLYLHRFANRLCVNDKFHAVTNTALRLVASMKRDWMQTGRRPSGICGAALFIAAHIHGVEKSKRDVVNIVHVGEATLAKRVKEFALTTSGDLTIEEFEDEGRALEAQHRKELQLNTIGAPAPAHTKGGCQHLTAGAAQHFAHGMCKVCYEEFLEVTGGTSAGADPPAFTAGLAPKKVALMHCPAELDGAAGGVPAAPAADVADDVADEELSELEDDEASLYLHTPEEAKLKELIWTELNREFLDCQSAKAAALESAAAKARPEDMLEPAETPEEATRRMLDAKKLSSKINYNALANLFSETSRGEQ